jgi:hypothetical protein
LPFVKHSIKFEDLFKQIEQCEGMSDKVKRYFSQVYVKKEDWARCYNKDIFTAGMFTNARIESFNASIKRFLNSSSPINYFFKAIDEYERASILKTEIEEQE